jgi:hypothetical protein
MSGRLDADVVVELAARMGLSVLFYRQDVYAIFAISMAIKKIKPPGCTSEPQISRRSIERNHPVHRTELQSGPAGGF